MDRAVRVEVECRFCGAKRTLTLPETGYARFLRGEAAVVCMPEVSADDREMLITGMCPACWKQMEEEIDDDDAEDADADGGDEGEATPG